jgi:hypothetical protein
MEATVDIRNIGQHSVPPPISSHALYKTWVFDQEEEGVQDLIQEIFTANLPAVDLTPTDLIEGMETP